MLATVFAAARSVLAGIAGIVLVVADHETRGQGSGIPWPYGLVVSGLALLAFAFAVPVGMDTRRGDRDQ